MIGQCVVLFGHGTDGLKQSLQAPAVLEFMLLYVIRSYLALSTQNSQIKIWLLKRLSITGASFIFSTFSFSLTFPPFSVDTFVFSVTSYGDSFVIIRRLPIVKKMWERTNKGMI